MCGIPGYSFLLSYKERFGTVRGCVRISIYLIYGVLQTSEVCVCSSVINLVSGKLEIASSESGISMTILCEPVSGPHPLASEIGV